jgi:hypothetical protein
MKARHITAALVLGTLVGCGGGSSLSHDAFVAAANSVCQTANAEFEELQQQFAEASADERRVIGVELSRRAGKRVEDLLALTPGDDADKRLLGLLRTGAAQAEKLARTGDVQLGAQVVETGKTLREEFRAAGIDECTKV